MHDEINCAVPGGFGRDRGQAPGKRAAEREQMSARLDQLEVRASKPRLENRMVKHSGKGHARVKAGGA
jgi:hypothetical protein